ncbi:MAG: substrate-binding domain-containing protein [Planctomycetota bacterium]|nr:substrate-binding domain-containing protein [Planctomycetota bacterium]
MKMRATSVVAVILGMAFLAGTAFAADGKKKVVFVSKGVHPFWTTVAGGVEHGADTNGLDYTILHPDKSDNAERQVTYMFDAIATNPDAIILAPVEMDALVAPCQDAMKKGIPVILVDTTISTDDYLIGFATNNETAGRMAADTMADLTGKKGKIFILSTNAAASSDSARERGFRERMKEAYPEINVIGSFYHEGNMSVATTQTLDIIMANPDLAGFYCINDYSTSGCGNGLIQANRTDIKIVGFDANEDIVALMEDGVVDAQMVQQPVKMGELGSEAAARFFRGELKLDEAPYGIQDTGCTVVPKEKVNDEDIQKLLFPLNFL